MVVDFVVVSTLEKTKLYSLLFVKVVFILCLTAFVYRAAILINKISLLILEMESDVFVLRFYSSLFVVLLDDFSATLKRRLHQNSILTFLTFVTFSLICCLSLLLFAVVDIDQNCLFSLSFFFSLLQNFLTNIFLRNIFLNSNCGFFSLTRVI